VAAQFLTTPSFTVLNANVNQINGLGLHLCVVGNAGGCASIVDLAGGATMESHSRSSDGEPSPTKRQANNETRKFPPQPVNENGSNGTGTRVRDRLCQIIRQHQLDPNLVKSLCRRLLRD
jgi:hypothetical protein